MKVVSSYPVPTLFAIKLNIFCLFTLILSRDSTLSTSGKNRIIALTITVVLFTSFLRSETIKLSKLVEASVANVDTAFECFDLVFIEAELLAPHCPATKIG